MPIFTALSVIDEAFQELGVTVPGETLPASASAKGLLLLKSLLSSASAEGVVNPTLQTDVALSLAAGVPQYYVGNSSPAGATMIVNYPPVRILSWRCNSGSFYTSGKVMSMPDFRAEVGKRPTLAQASVLPEFVGVSSDWHGTASSTVGITMQLAVFPVPATAPGLFYLDYYRALEIPSATGTNMDFPEGWFDFLSSNLALSLAPSYPRIGGVPEALAARAQNSKGVIVANNAAILGLPLKAE